MSTFTKVMGRVLNSEKKLKNHAEVVERRYPGNSLDLEERFKLKTSIIGEYFLI